MPEVGKGVQSNPWGGSQVTPGSNIPLSIPQIQSINTSNLPQGMGAWGPGHPLYGMPLSSQQIASIRASEVPPTPAAPTDPQQAAINNIPNANAIGNVNGTGESMMPNIPNYLDYAGQRFNNFQPLDVGGGGGIGNAFDNMFSHYGDQYAKLNGPQIPVEDFITPQMRNQMLNSAIGGNAAQRQSGMRDALNNFGGRGFTSESPALQATSNRLGLNEALANTQARTDIPIQTARQNADYRLGAMAANQNQRASDINSFIGLENAQTNRLSPLLSALVGLV